MANKENGWIKLHRSIKDNWVWEDTPFSYGQAWIDLLMRANHAESKTLFNAKLITIEQGAFITSVRKLCVEWGWSKDKTLKFLRTLEADGMIQRDSDNQRTKITVVNWGKYQHKEDDANTSEKPTVFDGKAKSRGSKQYGLGYHRGEEDTIDKFSKRLDAVEDKVEAISQ